MTTILGTEWRVLAYIHAIRGSALTTRTYGSKESAERAAQRLADSEGYTGNSFRAIEVRITADLSTVS